MKTGFNFQFSSMDAKRLLYTLLSFELCLVLAYVLMVQFSMPYSFEKLFDLDGEATLPAWFSSAQLLLIGILFLFSNNWPQTHKIANPKFLLLMGMVFIFLSMDESAVIHEKVKGILKIVHAPRFKGDHGIWIPIYLSIAAVLALVGYRTIKSMLNIYTRPMLIIITGLVVLFIGAIGLELIMYQLLLDAKDLQLYKLEVIFEELFEMVGASIILYGTILCALSDFSALTKESPVTSHKGQHQVIF